MAKYIIIITETLMLLNKVLLISAYSLLSIKLIQKIFLIDIWQFVHWFEQDHIKWKSFKPPIISQ